jgi:hypothetical protein
LGRLRNVDDGGCLHFYDTVCHQLDQFGHETFYRLGQLNKLDPNRKVLAADARRAMGMDAMMAPKS